MEIGRLEEILRTLEPLEEKTVRLRYGIGCQRQHSVEEMAGAYQIPVGEVVCILNRARHRLMQLGLNASQLRAAAKVPVSRK